MEADDLALVARARAGEPEAFRALIVRYQRKVYAVALGIVLDRDLAWDVAQEAFVRVHQHLAEFKGDSSFSTWILKIASHLAIDALRKERTSTKEELEEVRPADLAQGGEGLLATSLGSDPEHNLIRRELSSRMGEALAALPEKHRTILVLRELEGLSYEELAARLGIRRGTVMSRLFHARKKMQALLRDLRDAARSREGAEVKEGSS
ncbi:MAG TPA: sigma-70 family RNA polymerase sigma factor [Anaeromyxobacteraceae bacterium]|nr:sigma-70 family RNA polymerase sigma factor [Anaeromyxobacteraceae bacterium]